MENTTVLDTIVAGAKDEPKFVEGFKVIENNDSWIIAQYKGKKYVFNLDDTRKYIAGLTEEEKKAAYSADLFHLLVSHKKTEVPTEKVVGESAINAKEFKALAEADRAAYVSKAVTLTDTDKAILASASVDKHLADNYVFRYLLTIAKYVR
jgi:hypothetical protein